MAKLVRVAPITKVKKNPPGWQQRRFVRNEYNREQERKRLQNQLIANPGLALDLLIKRGGLP